MGNSVTIDVGMPQSMILVIEAKRKAFETGELLERIQRIEEAMEK